MIKIYVPKKDITNVTNEIFQEISQKFFGTSKYIIERENRQGRYIKILNSDSGEIHFVCFSNPENDSRNAHLMQFISPAFVDYFYCSAKNKKLDIYLINPGKNDKTDYIKFFYRCFLTLGINIIQLNTLGIGKIIPFYDYNDLKFARDYNREKNLGNKSTFFTDDDDHISFYGKVFGANAMETFILILTLKKITEKKIIYYTVIDNKSTKLSGEQTNILKKVGITFGETIDEISNSDINIGSDEKSLRNTPKFHYNLLKKFGEKKCYLCGCGLEHLIIGSHIERVTDIQNSKIYELEEKKKRIVDGDNGLRLCEDHDKMFEYGLIYFDGKNMEIKKDIDERSKAFIYNITFDVRKIYFENEKEDENVYHDTLGNKKFQIKKGDYTYNMHKYLNIHKERVSTIQEY